MRYTSDKSKGRWAVIDLEVADGPVFVLGWPMGRSKRCVRNHSSHLVILSYSILEVSSSFFLSLSSIKYLAPNVEEEIKEKSFWVCFVCFIVFMDF